VVVEVWRAQEAGRPTPSRDFLFTPQEYVRRFDGGAVASARFPWGQPLLDTLDALRGDPMDRPAAEQVGGLLAELLGGLSFRDDARCIVEALYAGRPVQLTFRFAAAELAALPWEMVRLGDGPLAATPARAQENAFRTVPLGALTGLVIRYEWPGTVTAAPRPAPPPEGGRILFAYSSRGGRVPFARQQSAIRRACWEANHPFDEAHDVLPKVSVARLSAALDWAPVAVLHVLCHGGAVRSGRDAFGLVWDDDEADGGADVIDAATLRDLLASHLGSLRLVVLCACHGGNPGALDSRLGSIAQELHRAGIPAVLASRYPLGADAADDLTTALYRALLPEMRSLEEAVLAARALLRARPRRVDWASLQLFARAADGSDHRPFALRPYRSLSAFTQADRAFYFGREGEIDAVVRALRGLAEAGRRRFLIVSGASGSGKSSLIQAGVVSRILSEQPREGAPGPVPVVPVLRPAALATLEGEPSILVVDQLEELLVAPGRDALLARAWALAERSTVLLSAREDLLCALEALPLGEGRSLGQLVGEGHHKRVAAMSRAQLRSAVLDPAQRTGVEPEPGLFELIWREIEGQPGGLPLVEYLLDELWRRRQDRKLTLAAYHDLGGVSGALERRADKVCADLPDALLRPLLLGLVDVGDAPHADTRRRATFAELCARCPDPARAAEVLDRLVDARLLVTSRDGAQRVVEVAHETLIRAWPRFRDAIEADRKRLAELRQYRVLVAQLGDGLLEGSALARARNVLAHARDGLTLAEIARIEQSETRERDARLVDEGRKTLGWDPARAAVLLGAVSDPARAAGWTMAAIQVLEKPIASRVSAPRPWTLTDGAVCPNGSRVVVTSGETLVWEVDRDAEPVTLAGRAATAQQGQTYQFSDDGRRLMVVEDDEALRVHDTATGEVLVTMRGNGWPADYKLAADGSAGVVTYRDGTMAAWLGGAEGLPMPPLPVETRLLDVEGGGDPRALVSYPDGRIDRVLLPDRGFVRCLELDGSRFQPFVAASGGLLYVDDDQPRVVRLQADGTPVSVAHLAIGTKAPHLLPGFAVRFSRDGRCVGVVIGDDAHVWRLDGIPDDDLHAAAWSGAGKIIDLDADRDRVLLRRGAEACVVDLKTDAVLAQVPVEGLASARFRTGGAELVTLDWQGRSQVWPAAAPERVQLYPAPLRSQISPDGAAWVGVEGALWQLARMTGASVERAAWGPIWGVAWMPDGSGLVVVAEKDGVHRVGLFAVEGGEPRILSPDLGWTVKALATGPDQVVAVGRESHNVRDASGAQRYRDDPPGRIQLWRAGASADLDASKLDAELLCAALDASGSRLAAGDRRGRVFVWDPATGALAAEMPFAHAVSALVFHPTQPRLLVGTRGGEVALVDLSTSVRRPIHSFGTGKWAWDLAFSPDGRRAALVGSQPEVLVVDLDGDAAPVELDGHQERATGARFSPDGAHLTTAALDHTVRRWLVDTVRLRAEVRAATRWSAILEQQVLAEALR
jgi:WD40 repeat protein